MKTSNKFERRVKRANDRDWYIYFDTMPGSGGELRMSLNNDELHFYREFNDVEVPHDWDVHWGDSMNIYPREFGYEDNEMIEYADGWEILDLVDTVLTERRYKVSRNKTAGAIDYITSNDLLYKEFETETGCLEVYDGMSPMGHKMEILKESDFTRDDALPFYIVVDGKQYGEVALHDCDYDASLKDAIELLSKIVFEIDNGIKSSKIAGATDYITLNDLKDYDVYDSEEYWNGFSPQGHEIAIGIDYEYDPDKIGVFIDGMPYDDIEIFGDFDDALHKAIERLSIYVFELENDVKFPRDYWGRPILGGIECDVEKRRKATRRKVAQFNLSDLIEGHYYENYWGYPVFYKGIKYVSPYYEELDAHIDDNLYEFAQINKNGEPVGCYNYVHDDQDWWVKREISLNEALELYERKRLELEEDYAREMNVASRYEHMENEASRVATCDVCKRAKYAAKKKPKKGLKGLEYDEDTDAYVCVVTDNWGDYMALWIEDLGGGYGWSVLENYHYDKYEGMFVGDYVDGDEPFDSVEDAIADFNANSRYANDFGNIEHVSRKKHRTIKRSSFRKF